MKYESIPSLTSPSKRQNYIHIIKHRFFDLIYLLSLQWQTSFVTEFLIIIYQCIQLLTFPFNSKVINSIYIFTFITPISQFHLGKTQNISSHLVTYSNTPRYPTYSITTQKYTPFSSLVLCFYSYISYVLYRLH